MHNCFLFFLFLLYHVQESYCFLGHYCLEHSKQFSDKYHSDIISSVCLSTAYKLTVT